MDDSRRQEASRPHVDSRPRLTSTTSEASRPTKAARIDFGGLAPPSFKHHDKVCQGFSWHSISPTSVSQARDLLAHVGHKTYFDFESLAWFDEGFYLPRKLGRGCSFEAGYHGLSRILGHLAEDSGLTPKWMVLGHEGPYDPQAWDAVKIAADVMPSTRSDKAQGSAEPSRPSDSHVFCRCPTLKLCTGGQSLRDSAANYELGDLIGKGFFGQVFAATSASGDVVVKRLKKDDGKVPWTSAYAEAHVLDMSRGQAHIVQFLDVFVAGGTVHLVLGGKVHR